MKELMKLNKELILSRTILPTFFKLSTYFSKQSTFAGKSDGTSRFLSNARIKHMAFQTT